MQTTVVDLHHNDGRSRGFARPTILVLAVGSAALAEAAQADNARLASKAPFVVEPDREFTVDAGLLFATPAALTGALSTGISAGLTRRCGCHIEYGARASWSTTSGTSTTWSVTNSDLRLRVTGGLRHSAGRGTFALRAGLGATLVHETRERNQGARAGLTGSDLMTNAWRTLPAGELEVVVSVHVVGAWLVTMSGGPTLHLAEGGLDQGYTAQLGVAWQP